MDRSIDKILFHWKQQKNRKVLLVRGARQVGKTYSIRQLGKYFEYYLEINFEEDPDIASFFKGSLNPEIICDKLSLYFNEDIIAGKTLLFFDEIQSCPEAIKSLRFFYEKMPDLHVIAAGSLLEFALSEISSFGVGRIQSVFMYPMTFSEFLRAHNDKMNKLIKVSNNENPIDEVIHEKILEQLKIFLIIGGMPEVVKLYIADRNLKKCQIIIDNLLTTLKDDFAKYKQRAPVLKIEEVFNSIIYQAGNKFKYSNISDNNIQAYKDPLELLIKSGLAYKIYHTNAAGLPLAALINKRKFKILPFDTGIYQRCLGLDLSQYIISDLTTIINRGKLCEIFTGLELIAYQSNYSKPQLYYWHREAKSSNAEVDYVISNDTKIYPIEVKSGTKGQMQSLFIFLKEKNINYGIRISQENFTLYDKVIVIPLYAVKNIFEMK